MNILAVGREVGERPARGVEDGGSVRAEGVVVVGHVGARQYGLGPPLDVDDHELAVANHGDVGARICHVLVDRLSRARSEDQIGVDVVAGRPAVVTPVRLDLAVPIRVLARLAKDHPPARGIMRLEDQRIRRADIPVRARGRLQWGLHGLRR
ncbi:hypothetical protein [Polyangium fumosum]|uniref:Uncharacterized protein n=1 Tax=Polyangium fumosum TaxID=889272 RepID=A0A4U1JGN6_9BACT|nr:hypothetical protein [Polyangium fumosum]TKD10303.1 hypothetical protein E8A74_07575 [Polyangium fumosum]